MGQWHDVRRYADGVHLVRGFRKTLPHYRVTAEKARRKAQGKARMAERRSRKRRGGRTTRENMSIYRTLRANGKSSQRVRPVMWDGVDFA